MGQMTVEQWYRFILSVLTLNCNVFDFTIQIFSSFSSFYHAL